MKVLKNEKHACFDVDDTLVMWGDKDYTPDPTKIAFKCPHTESTYYLKPNKSHINFLKVQKSRGFDITVWSQGGWEWAETVIKTLELENYVDTVQTKPLKYVDDLPASEWMDRVYFGDNDG